MGGDNDRGGEVVYEVERTGGSIAAMVKLADEMVEA